MGQFDYFVEQSKKYQQASDDQAKDKLKQETHDAFVAWHFMQAANYRKYGSLLTNLATQYSLGNNQYPEHSMQHWMFSPTTSWTPSTTSNASVIRTDSRTTPNMRNPTPPWMPPAMLRRARNTGVIAVDPAITT